MYEIADIRIWLIIINWGWKWYLLQLQLFEVEVNRYIFYLQLNYVTELAASVLARSARRGPLHLTPLCNKVSGWLKPVIPIPVPDWIHTHFLVNFRKFFQEWKLAVCCCWTTSADCLQEPGKYFWMLFCNEWSKFVQVRLKLEKLPRIGVSGLFSPKGFEKFVSRFGLQENFTEFQDTGSQNVLVQGGQPFVECGEFWT